MALVLLVEDDFAIREALAESLTDAGLLVASACDGRDALGYLEHARAAGRPLPSLIVTDLAMPHLGGCAFIDRVRDIPGMARVPIVVVTAAAQLPELPGATAVIRKPIREWERVLASLVRLASASPGGDRLIYELHPRLTARMS